MATGQHRCHCETRGRCQKSRQVDLLGKCFFLKHGNGKSNWFWKSLCSMNSNVFARSFQPFLKLVVSTHLKKNSAKWIISARIFGENSQKSVKNHHRSSLTSRTILHSFHENVNPLTSRKVRSPEDKPTLRYKAVTRHRSCGEILTYPKQQTPFWVMDEKWWVDLYRLQARFPMYKAIYGGYNSIYNW